VFKRPNQPPRHGSTPFREWFAASHWPENTPPLRGDLGWLLITGREGMRASIGALCERSNSRFRFFCRMLTIPIVDYLTPYVW